MQALFDEGIHHSFVGVFTVDQECRYFTPGQIEGARYQIGVGYGMFKG